MITNNNCDTCCDPQKLTINNATGYLSISDGNSVYLGTVISLLGIKTPVIDFNLSGYLLTLIYTDSNGEVQGKTVDLTALAAGGSISATDTATLDLNLTSAVLTGSVNISTASGNALTANSDGLYVPTSTLSISTSNTNTLNLVNSANTISGSVNISASSGNFLQSLSDGLYVGDMRTYLIAGSNITITGSGSSGSPYVIGAGGFTNVPLTVNSSPTIQLISSGTAGHTLTANVNVSTSLGNAITVNSDGLFVSQSVVVPYTDAKARAAISSSAPITYDNTTGIIGITKSTGSVDGYLSSIDWTTFNNKIGGGISIGSSSSTPVYAGVSSKTLQFNGLRAGSNVSLQMSGNDIVISATIPSVNASSVLDFIVGDGGTFTPVNGASSMSSSLLQNKTILGVWVEGVKIAGVVRSSGALYYTYTGTTGSITLTNGTFTTDSYYSIEYR